MLTLAVALLCAGVLALVGASPAVAGPTYPHADGRCVDRTGVLGPRLCAKVTAVLLRDEARTSDEIAVAVVPSTGRTSIETWSTGLFNAWGVGKKHEDNGVLLVVAVDDRQVRLETGRGMTERLSDSDARDIIDTVIIPRFTEGDYAVGILAGLDEVRRRTGQTVARDAQLLRLAAMAPAAEAAAHTPAAPAPAHVDVPAEEDVWADGDPAVVDYPAVADPGDVGGFPGWAFVPFLAVGLIALIAAARGRGGSAALRDPARRRSDSLQHGSWAAGSTGSDSWSTGGGGFDSSSGGSSSGFGGGGSDGGGGSGSW